MGALTQGMKNTSNGNDTQIVSVNSIVKSNATFFQTYYKSELEQKQAMETAIAIGNDPKFNNCTPESIVKSIMDSVRLGLDATSGINHTWLVPYKDKVQLQISAKGYIQLLYRAGWLTQATVVYKCDDFSFSQTQNGKEYSFIANNEARNLSDKDWVVQNLLGILVESEDIRKRKICDFIHVSQIEKLRLTSPNQKWASKWAKPDVQKRIQQKLPIEIWYDWYAEMAKSKAIKKVAKDLPLGDKIIAKAIKLDDYAEAGLENEYEAESIDLTLNENDIPADELIEDIKVSPMEDFENKIQTLGFEIETVKKTDKGSSWAKIIAKNENANYKMITQINGVIPKDNYFVKNVTELVV